MTQIDLSIDEFLYSAERKLLMADSRYVSQSSSDFDKIVVHGKTRAVAFERTYHDELDSIKAAIQMKTGIRSRSTWIWTSIDHPSEKFFLAFYTP